MLKKLFQTIFNSSNTTNQFNKGLTQNYNTQEYKELTDYLVKNEKFKKGARFIDGSISNLKSKILNEIDGISEEEKKRIEYDNKNKKH